MKPANTTLSRKCSERILIFPGWEVHIWFHCCGVCIPLKWSIGRLWISWKKPRQSLSQIRLHFFIWHQKVSLHFKHVLCVPKTLNNPNGTIILLDSKKTKQNCTQFRGETWGYISCWFWSFNRPGCASVHQVLFFVCLRVFNSVVVSFYLLQSTINPVDGIYQPPLATPVDNTAMPTQTTLPTGSTHLPLRISVTTEGDSTAPCCSHWLHRFPTFFFLLYFY